jgi:hypothetical protein
MLQPSFRSACSALKKTALQRAEPLRLFYFQFTRTLRSFESNSIVAGPPAGARGTDSMSIQEVSAERFAQLFHQYQHALVKDCTGNSNDPSGARAKDTWAEVPPSEKNLLIAAARLALLEVELLPSERQSRRYFAKPGEAEWGC